MKRTLETNEGNSSKRLRPPSRSVYLGNFPQNGTYYDICKLANQYGALELVKIVENKNCAFLNFVSQESAENFYSASQQEPVIMEGRTLRIGWGQCKPIPEEINAAITDGATRNLWIGNISELVTEDDLFQAFLQFGQIENVVLLRQRNMGFVNMTSVKNAIRAKQETEGGHMAGQPLKINYAKEGAKARRPAMFNGPQPAFPPPLRGPGPFQAQGQGYPPQVQQQMPPQQFQQSFESPVPQKQIMQPEIPISRAVYIGDLPEDVTHNDLCKLANGFGAIEKLSYHPEKKFAFANFIDPAAAQSLMSSGVSLNDKRLRLGWAKSAPLRPDIVEAVRQGATRNLYVGNLPEGASEGDLEEIFSPFAQQFDSIVVLPAKKIAFVNFLDIKQAMKAREITQSQGVTLGDKPLRVNFAKEVIRKRKNLSGPGPAPGVPQFSPQQAPPQQQPQQFFQGQQPPQYGQVQRQGQFQPQGQIQQQRVPSQGGQAQNADNSRAVYLGSLPQGSSVQDITSLADQFGPIENLSMNEQKRCAFVNYVSPQSALNFYQRAQQASFSIRGTNIRIGWAKCSPINSQLLSQISAGATRNLFLGNVSPDVTSEDLEQLFSGYGALQNVVILSDRKIAFVNLCSVAAAVNAREQLQGVELGGLNIKINFAKANIKRARNQEQ